MTPKIKRNLLFALVVFLAIVIIREVVFRGPQAAASRLVGYRIVAPQDTATEIFFRDKTLIYDIFYGSVVPMGKLMITTRKTGEGIVLRAAVTTEGTPLGGALKAQAVITSLLDPRTLEPTQYTEFTQVKDKKKTKVFVFDREKMVVRVGGRTMTLTEGMVDPLSSLFLLLSATPSREVLTSTFISKKEPYTMTLTPLKQKVTVAAYSPRATAVAATSSRKI